MMVAVLLLLALLVEAMILGQEFAKQGEFEPGLRETVYVPVNESEFVLEDEGEVSIVVGVPRS
ncbi:MAG: hypothetical protein JW834_01530 [Candidatus Diapherotrites archaeon]|nr:hypothetical protein [Candidatus Diapherotrites archaeon]